MIFFVRGAIANAASAAQIQRVRSSLIEITEVLKKINQVDKDILEQLRRKK